MIWKNCSSRQITIVDEIIDNATELPVESQNLILMMAKAMQYTRDCMMREHTSEHFTRKDLI